MKKLQLFGPDNRDDTAIPVVALAHNEANILPDFLDHYRALGRVTFLIVDDHSTDGTSDILAQAPDVTVFHPVPGSTYAEDKADWRSELLDTYAVGRWCLVPDLDEHFVFLGANTLSGYVEQLEGEGAEAVVTLMVDMYADAPLKNHLYRREDGWMLGQQFTCFDGPEAYAMRPVMGEAGRAYPTPPIAFHGGPRHRIQRGPLFAGASGFWASVLRSQLGLDRTIRDPRGFLWRKTVGRAARSHFQNALNMTKLGLVRWQKGMRFNGGAHKLDRHLRVSESIAGFLHYPFTRGEAGIRYLAERGQHAGGAKHYQSLLQRDVLDQSLAGPQTRVFKSSEDLDGLLRPVP